MKTLLLSLPPAMTAALPECEARTAATALAFHDPVGARLGSGGGTAYTLYRAWQQTAGDRRFSDWIRDSFKTVIHGGGQSRRLPAYAATGKLFIPIPVFRWSRGQRLDQSLLDLQAEFLNRVHRGASGNTRCMISSGDVLLQSATDLPPMPEADVVLLGLWAQPEEAQHFGVLFCDRAHPQRLEYFLQKPAPDRIREGARDNVFLLDVGVWLLSEKAVSCLMKKCGWRDESGGSFAGGVPSEYDLYGSWALHLGRQPVRPDPEVSALSVAVVPLPDGEFYHFGSTRDMIESSYRLQTKVVDQLRLGAMGARPHPKQFVQNARFACPLRQDENHTLWVENSSIPSTWSLSSGHALTGVPQNEWTIRLTAGQCLDFVPVGEQGWVLRAYGMDDAFRGDCASPNTQWMGRPLCEWFRNHGLEKEGACLAGRDIQSAPLHVLVGTDPSEADWIQWLLSTTPVPNEAYRKRWIVEPRFSSDELSEKANLARLVAQRRENAAASLPAMARNPNSIFYKVDLRAAADHFSSSTGELPPPPSAEGQPLVGMHDRMFRAEVARRRGNPAQGEALEREAFDILKECVVREVERRPVTPRTTLLSDQIAWGRCPIRLDLAGGWTDTPPYCLEFGGRVVNVALDLNGQPPIQVFARMSQKPGLTIRSIDQGVEERIDTAESLLRHEGLGGGFAVARVALALAGFHPRFSAVSSVSLVRQLEAFGGGLELSMLAAVPKGSGLGVSSILAATLLGVLSDVCDLSWNRLDLMARVSALEQLLTSGGGWQDQLGGALGGIKWIETAPGLDQRPTLRWLPGHFFLEAETKQSMALYYTGITRVARSVLGEIVRGLFLNESDRLRTLDGIGRNAAFAQEAIQQQDFEAFIHAVQNSWILNQELDSGTNPPEVQSIIEKCGPSLAACKLVGAGGGGYLFLMARNPEAMQEVRRRLNANPPNDRARFVEFSLSEQGLQITRS